MITKTVAATTDATDLKSLMETAGHTFTGNNDKAVGCILQIDPDEAVNTVDVMSEGETAGITLSNTEGAPTTISFQVDRVRRTYLKASASTVDVKVLIEQL